MYLSFSDHQQLTEGLIRSTTLEQVVSNLKKRLSVLWEVWMHPLSAIVYIRSQEVDVQTLLDEYHIIEQILKPHGWYISTYSINNMLTSQDAQVWSLDDFSIDLIKNQNRTVLCTFKLESYHDQLMVQGEDYTRYVYHLTYSNFLDSIIDIGLVPKNKNKKSYHPKRIYVSPTKEGAINLMDQFQQTQEDEFALLRIDLNKTKNVKFYKDPNYIMGFYTTDNIPPSSITIINDE